MNTTLLQLSTRMPAILSLLGALSIGIDGASAQTATGRLSSNGLGMTGSSGACGQGMGQSGNRGTFVSGSPGTSAMQANPYASLASGSYANSYSESDISGALRGAADLISAQGRWMTSLQQGDLLKEQNRQATIATERKDFEQYLYERTHTPTFEQERQRVAAENLKRSLNEPPVSEILSGQSLNTLLDDLSKRRLDETDDQSISLDEDVLRHINLTAGRGNAGLLKNEGRLSWPVALREDAYKTDRELLNSLAPEAIYQAINGRVDAGTMHAMTRAVERLRGRLAENVKELTANQFIEANRFLADLSEGLRALSRPDAGNHFNGKYAARGRTAADLIRHMIANGLRFAPAVPGDAPAYVSVHRALAAYDAGTSGRAIAER